MDSNQRNGRIKLWLKRFVRSSSAAPNAMLLARDSGRSEASKEFKASDERPNGPTRKPGQEALEAYGGHVWQGAGLSRLTTPHKLQGRG
jgi:hypothetical protein